MKREWAFTLAVWLVAWPALAETHRVAVVVGNNAATGESAPLRFAEDDAGKFARVLAELGGVAPDDLFLAEGKPLGALRDVLAQAKARVAAYHQRPEDRVLLFFYFSGHSDGEALELGPDRLAYGDLLAWLRTTGADVRVVVVDSCQSGALLAVKGGRPGPGYRIRLADDLATSGQVLLASSAANEAALESSHVRGSVFTYYFIAGLRGAADDSGDGRVTLGEAYRYAYQHTLATSAQTLIGPQHPEYDYRLSGQGELVLTDLSRPSAVLRLPSGFSRISVFDVRRDQLLADLGPDAPRRLAVEAGEYALRAIHGHEIVAGRVHLDDGQQLAVTAADLTAVEPLDSAEKGMLGSAPAAAVSEEAPPHRSSAPWWTAGAGGLVLLGGGILGAVAISNGDSTHPAVVGGQPVTEHSLTAAQASAANAEADAAIGLLVAGGVALAVGVVWGLVAR
ncbi:MAG TPA: caspase family protein [Myxococcales bacterium]|nr:caspase family protein [Myxococcales bacterium]